MPRDPGATEGNGYRCLVFNPHSYSGRGPAQSCASVLPGIASAGFRVEVFLPRLRRPYVPGVRVVETLPRLIRRLPMRITAPVAIRSMETAFVRELDAADPARTVAYFWPDVPLGALRAANRRGIMAVREMINNPVAAAKPILDEAYRRFGVPPHHGATPAKAEHEALELPLHDRFFVSNAEVVSNLAKVGIGEDRMLLTSYGWRAERFARQGGEDTRHDGKFRALYVGTIEIRKGVPELLAAWRDAQVDGVLVLAGELAPELRTLVAEHVATGRVEHLGFVEDVGALYRSADVFVFPSHEEGGPQVTVEAGGCGLPIIATPMGVACFVEDGVNGIVVPPGDVPALTAAIRRIAGDAELRARMARASEQKGRGFGYLEVGARRGAMLIAALRARANV